MFRNISASVRRAFVVAFDGERVTFKWKDCRAKGAARYKLMTLDTDEFIRRFLIHVLPAGSTAPSTSRLGRPRRPHKPRSSIPRRAASHAAPHRRRAGRRTRRTAESPSVSQGFPFVQFLLDTCGIVPYSVSGRLPRALTEVYEEAQQWIVGHGIFAPGEMGAGAYEEAILAVAP
jgi:hypothetical protein